MGNELLKEKKFKEKSLRLTEENDIYQNFGKWKILKNEILGKGTFTTVLKGLKPKTGELVAIKKIFCFKILDNQKILKSTSKEIFHLKKCSCVDNPFLVKILDHFKCSQEKSNSKYLVLEFCNGGNLEKEITKNNKKGFCEKKSLEIAYQILIGLKTLSDLEIIHRNLKPANILINKDKSGKVYKIGGFGLSKKCRNFTEKTGTLKYMGPEHYNKNFKKTKAVDIWAFGLIVHEMIFGKSPYGGINPQYYEREVMIRVVHKKYSIPKTKKIERATKNLLVRCLNKNPEHRITVHALLNHPCFKFCRERVHDRVKNLDQIIDNFSIYKNMKIESKYHEKIFFFETEELLAPDQMKLLKMVEMISKSFKDYRDITDLILETSESMLERIAEFSDYEKKISQCLLCRAFFRANLLLKIFETELLSDQLEILLKKIPFCGKVEINEKIWKKFYEGKIFWKIYDVVFKDFCEIRDELEMSDWWKKNNQVEEYKFIPSEFDKQEKELNHLRKMIHTKVKIFLSEKKKNCDFEEIARLQLIYDYEKYDLCLPLDYDVDEKIFQLELKNNDEIIKEIESLFEEKSN